MTAHTSTTQPVFDRLLLPVADEADAEATCTAVKPYVDAGATELVVLHVTETDGESSGSEEAFDRFRDACSTDGVVLETELRSGPDAVAEIAAAADELDVTAIGVLPRSKNLVVRLLSEETTATLISSTDVPVIVLPRDPATSDDERLSSRGNEEPWIPRLLVPVGESMRALDAVEFASSAYSDPEVTALYVREPPAADVYSEMTPGVSSEVEGTDRRRRREAESTFRHASELAAELGVELATVTRPGDVVDGIVRYAEEESIDMIVVGSEGGDRPDGRLLGDVARSLIEETPVPAVIV
jgi:nucleotide-binding universal stress UspA family protein